MASSNNRRIAKNTGLLYIRMLIVMCVQLYTSRIILEALGVSDFGIYSVVGGIVLMFSAVVGSLGSATSRFFTVEIGRNDFEKLKKTFSSALFLHVLFGILIVVASETIGLWFMTNKMEIPVERLTAAHWVFQFSIITCFLSFTQVPYNAAIIAHEDMGVYAYIGMFDAVCKLLIAFLIKSAPFDRLVYYGLLVFILQVIVMMMYRVYCMKKYAECHYEHQRDRGLYKSMLSYGVYDFVGNISVMAQGQGLNMVLNVFCGPVVNAARGIAYQVQAAATQFSGNFLTAVNPQIIKYYAQGKNKELMTLVHRSSIFAFLLMFVIGLPLTLEIHYILTLWLGSYPSYTDSFTIIVLLTSLLNGFRRPRITIFHATGNIRLSNIVTGGILCMALPLGYVLMQLGCSPNSVFWGMFATTVIADCTNMMILKRYFTYSIRDFLIKVHLKCATIFAVSIVLVYPLTMFLEESFFRVVTVSLWTVVVVGICTWLIALDTGERHKVRIAARKFLSRKILRK